MCTMTREPLFEYRAIIKRVVDGDTIDVDIDLGFNIWIKNERLRLYGINAPETRTKDKDEKIRGIEAKDYLMTLLSEGTECVIMTRKDKKGKFGRMLATFFIDGIDVNRAMIEEGHAVQYMID